jgi:hypothetical protein
VDALLFVVFSTIVLRRGERNEPPREGCQATASRNLKYLYMRLY